LKGNVRATDHAVGCTSCGAILPAPDAACDRCLMRRALDDVDAPPLGPGFLDDLPLPAQGEVTVGKYTILNTVARGGMGVVYRARELPLNRIVALKMLLGGAHAGDAFRQRFLREARAAARLNHPGIVQVLDWGDDQGQPFYAMEFVEGDDLGLRTRGEPLAPRRAAEIVRDLAGAVEYAHSQGVLHRDLKPSNVLLDPQDRPRITDFGLARLAGDEQGLTHSGDLLGTPGYLPPEQASSRCGKTGVWSDVYGLGGILYGLITGRPPFVAASAPEVLRAVTEQEPPPPRQLNASVPADLETICLKCLEKNTARRYASALELAGDLNRYLNHEPIRARPASSIYKARKWVEKHRLAAAFALVALVAMCAGTAAVWRQAVLARRASVRAEASARTARIETAKSRETTAFLKELLGGITPDQAFGRDTALLKEMLVLAAKRADTTLTNQPEVEAEVREVMAATARHVAMLDDALRHAERALVLRERLSGPGHQATVPALVEVALAAFERGDLERAEALLRRALAFGGARWRPDSPDRLKLLVNLAEVEIARGNYAAAEPRLLSVLEIQKRTPGPEALETLVTERAFVRLLQGRAKYSEAVRRQQRILDAYRRHLTLDAPEMLQAAAELAEVKAQSGEVLGAAMVYQNVLEQQERILGRAHNHTLRTRVNLAALFGVIGQNDEAEEVLREVLATLGRNFGETHPDTVAAKRHLAAELLRQGRPAEAEPLAREVLADSERRHGSGHADTLEATLALAEALAQLKRAAAAGGIFRDVRERARRSLGEDHLVHLAALRRLAVINAEMGELATAEELGRAAVAAHERVFGQKNRETALASSHLARVLDRLGRSGEAEEIFRAIVEVQEAVSGPLHPETVHSIRELARLNVALGRTNEARPWQAKLAEREPRLGSPFPPGAAGLTLGNVAYVRADQLRREGQFAEPLAWLRLLAASDARRNKTPGEMSLYLNDDIGRLLSEWAWVGRPGVGAPGADSGTNALARAREAEKMLRDCLATRERIQSAPRWRLPETRSRLGFAVLSATVNDESLVPEARNARLAEAEKLLLESAAALEAESSVTSGYRREAATRLVRLYEVLGKAGSAARWQDRVETLRPPRRK
jgi:tetratricopeptide (TPR) repeat protein/predicted Ser/Thr protein kinase